MQAVPAALPFAAGPFSPRAWGALWRFLDGTAESLSQSRPRARGGTPTVTGLKRLEDVSPARAWEQPMPAVTRIS
jgi:hypothetical protein